MQQSLALLERMFQTLRGIHLRESERERERQREAYERNVVLAACVATWTAARQNVFSPGGSRRDVDQIPTAVIWGSLAESVCGRVGLTVAPESGAYTVACIDLRRFQEELPHYIALKTKQMFTLDAATP